MEANRISYWKNKPEWTIRQMIYLLNEVDPVLGEYGEGLQKEKLLTDLSNWDDWASGCPELSPIEQMPMDTSVNARKLLHWVQSLDGVEIPACWQSLIVPETQEIPLGDRERENLLLTIGALAMIVAKKPGAKTGTMEQPNISGISALCAKQAGEATGMAISSLRKRLTDGINLLNEKK
jgi:hypothetical protein